MIAATELRLVLVTPETTLLDERVRSMRFPMYDGQIGVLPGRAPLVGRLGIGELKLESSAGGSVRYFIDGGFVQIKGSVVTLLTDRAIPADEIDVNQAKSDLAVALAEVPTSEESLAAKERAVERARRMSSLG
ncbi:MAG: F0F1 ATP synthase subunit epsilon [Planctomycetaceae bacterium]|nr:F0F1 ATP synthase subunit epsilon [Planctomycetaceae bacterium]